MKVLFLTLDGYSDWVPTKEQIVDLPDFTPEEVALHISEGDTNVIQHLGDAITLLPNSITVNHEEGGTIAIKLT